MMCYKDQTFCSSDCINGECFRYFGKTEERAAEDWWGGKDYPVAFSDFSPTCSAYSPPLIQLGDTND